MEENKKNYFDVVRMSRLDFMSIGYDASKLSDAEMERVASKIGEVLVGEYFWDMLRIWAEDMLELPKCETEED